MDCDGGEMRVARRGWEMVNTRGASKQIVSATPFNSPGLSVPSLTAPWASFFPISSMASYLRQA